MAQISPKILHVCPSWIEDIPNNEFNTIQRAIDVIPNYGRYTIKLHDNFMGVPELILTNDRIQVKIDGQGDFGLFFTYGVPICTLDSRKSLKFTNITYIRGEAVILRDDSYFTLNKCESVMTRIDMIAGKYANVYIYNTKLYGTSYNPAITIFNPDSKLLIYDSYIKGGYKNPAIYFNSTSDKKVILKNNVLLHYDGVNNYPIQKQGSVFVGLNAYNCSGTEILCPNLIANYTATNNDNKADPEINY